LTNVSIEYVTGGCNEHPKPPSPLDDEFLLLDEISKIAGLIGIFVN
jgi:hypothetical protein